MRPQRGVISGWTWILCPFLCLLILENSKEIPTSKSNVKVGVKVVKWAASLMRFLKLIGEMENGTDKSWSVSEKSQVV